MSDRENEEVSERERMYDDGSDPALLDIIDVPLIAPKPKMHQPENWLLDPRGYWVKVGEYPRRELNRLVEAPGTLWADGSSTYHGCNDQVAVAGSGRIENSLVLVNAGDLKFIVLSPAEIFGDPKCRVQVEFRLAGVSYRLSVTDPRVEVAYLAKSNGAYRVSRSYLTISLGEPFRGHYYKLVAAVIGAE